MWKTVPIELPVGHSIVFKMVQPYDRAILRPQLPDGGIELVCEQPYEQWTDGKVRNSGTTRTLRSAECHIDDAFHITPLIRLLNPKWNDSGDALECEVVVLDHVCVTVESGSRWDRKPELVGS
jgi:hypothetical protein